MESPDDTICGDPNFDGQNGGTAIVCLMEGDLTIANSTKECELRVASFNARIEGDIWTELFGQGGWDGRKDWTGAVIARFSCSREGTGCRGAAKRVQMKQVQEYRE